jgi:S1-C subfamily serine protease
MRSLAASSALCAIFGSIAALGQTANVLSDFSMKMEMHGSSAADLKDVKGLASSNLADFLNELPTNQLSQLTQNPVFEASGTTRSAKDAQIYRTISPSVVLVANKEGFGSGSLVSTTGDVLTNWHVVNGYSYVALIFKPAIEGKEPTRDETKLGPSCPI